jgi:prepilin-type processing-associated H-X9-DG protein
MMAIRPLRAGVTVLEALVALTIVAAAMSLIVPSMNGARRGAKRVTCMNTMAELVRGAALYAKNFDDWIIGSPEGSGAYLQEASQAWGPAVQTWDFMGPMEAQWNMGMIQPSQGGPISFVARRFNDLRGHPTFSCVSNDFLAPQYAGPDAGVGPMVSYNTIAYALWREASWPTNHEQKPPPDWQPSVVRIGNPANKVFCADGARYSTGDTPPDYDLTVQGGYGGAFADSGPYTMFTRSWDRSWAPGNDPVGTVDARTYAFRHSSAEPPPGAPANAFKLNLAFYDGHVETQGDQTAANPYQWLPRASRLDTSCLWPDIAAMYGPGEILIGD